MKPIAGKGDSNLRGRWAAALLRPAAGVALLIAGSVAGLLRPSAAPEASALPPQTFEASAQLPSVVPIPIGLSGTITCPVLVDTLAPGGQEAVFIGTSWGLYVVAGGGAQSFIYCPAPVVDVALVDDATGDGTKEIAVCLASTAFPGVHCYDGTTGTELWSSFTTQGAVIEDVGWAEVQSLPGHLEVVPDVDSDGFRDVAVSCSGCLYLLQGNTGRAIWTLEAHHLADEGGDAGKTACSLTMVRDAGDVNGDGVVDLALAGEESQVGLLGVVSGKSGRLLLKRTLDQKVADLRCFEVDGRKKALLGSEDSVLLVDLGDGNGQWEASINSISAGCETDLSVIGDTSDDGVPEVLVFQHAVSQSQMILLNGASGEALWRTPTPVAGDAHAHVANMDGRDSVLVPLGRFDSVEKVAIVDLEDGRIRQTLQVPCPAEAPSSPVEEDERWIAAFGGTDFILVSSSGDLMCVSSDAGVIWYCPRVRDPSVQEGHLNGDSVADLVLCSSSVLSAIDGATHAELWRYQVPYGEWLASGGIGLAKVAPHPNQDGGDDVVCCEGSVINLLSGTDRQLLMSYRAESPILSVDLLTIGQDSLAFGIGTAAGMMILNTSGEPVWTRPYAGWDGEEACSACTFVALDDVNGDGTDDLAVSLGNRLIVATSTLQSGGLDFASRRLIDWGAGTAVHSLSPVLDMNRDGIQELSLVKDEGESVSTLVVVSPPTGETLMEMDRQGGLAVDLARADFDGDGYPDSIAYSQVDQEVYGGSPAGSLAQGPFLRIISGQSGALLWEHRYDSPITGITESPDGIPAVPVSDMSGDGLPDLAFTQTDLDGGYVETLTVYDVNRNQLLKKIALNEPATDDNHLMQLLFGAPDGCSPGGNIQGTHDAEPGHTTLLIMSPALYRVDTGVGGSSAELVTHPTAVSLDNDAVSRFLLPCSVTAETYNPAGLVAIHSDGGPCVLSVSGQSPLVSPIEGHRLSSPIHVQLNEAASGGLTKVYLDHVSCVSTYRQQITLPVAAGDHRLTVYSLDRWGQLQQQTVSVEIRERTWVPILTLLLLLLLTTGICVPRLMRTWEKRALRIDHG